jgi:regulator of cell morphogenesis and NO signaling
MSQKFSERALSEIATSLPAAMAVFRRHNLDYCFAGNVSLADAATSHGLDLAGIETELAALASAPQQPPEDTEPLIDRILARFHEVHRRELQMLQALAEAVEKVHAGRPDVPVGLAAFLKRLTAELDSHMQKEEQILFPMMRAGRHPMIGGPIGMMRREHVEHGRQVAELTALTGGFVPPEDACGTWHALYTGLRKLADDLIEHIHTENSFLFPRFGA